MKRELAIDLESDGNSRAARTAYTWVQICEIGITYA